MYYEQESASKNVLDFHAEAGFVCKCHFPEEGVRLAPLWRSECRSNYLAPKLLKGTGLVINI